MYWVSQGSTRRNRTTRKLKAKDYQAQITETGTNEVPEKSTKGLRLQKIISDSSPQIQIRPAQNLSKADLPPRKDTAQNNSTIGLHLAQFQHIFNWGDLV